MRTETYTKAKISEEFQKYLASGKKLTYSEFYKTTKIGQLAIERHFESWSGLKRTFGIEAPERKKRKDTTTKEQVIEALRSGKNGRYIQRAAIMHFGSIDAAIKESLF